MLRDLRDLNVPCNLLTVLIMILFLEDSSIYQKFNVCIYTYIYISLVKFYRFILGSKICTIISDPSPVQCVYPYTRIILLDEIRKLSTVAPM